MVKHNRDLFQRLVRREHQALSTCPRDAETLQTEFPFLTDQRPIENTERDETIAGEQPEKQMASFMQNNLQNKSDQRTNDTPGKYSHHLKRLYLGQLLHQFIPCHIRKRHDTGTHQNNADQTSDAKKHKQLQSTLHGKSLTSIIM